MKTYTMGAVARIFGIPYQTLRAWGTRGFLSFARRLEDGPPHEVESSDVDGFVSGGWSRFHEGEVYLIALFSELTKAGIPLPVAAYAAENMRGSVLLEHKNDYRLCVATEQELYGLTTGKSGDLHLESNWFGPGGWRITWLTGGGSVVRGPSKIFVPICVTCVDVAGLRRRVKSAIEADQGGE